MDNKYIIALDQGTTSSRTLIVNSECRIFTSAQKDIRQIFPRPGWVEHDPEEIWATQYGTAVEAMAKAGLTGEDIAAIGIANQRETTIVWDRKTSRPLYNAIVWQDRRTADYCEELKKRKLTEKIRKKTGLIIDAYFSATKIKWILDNVPGAKAKAMKGELCFGTVDSWLTWKLTSGKLHITDVSNASRTMLFNIDTLRWDEELLELFGIPESMLPLVMPSSGLFGETAVSLFSSKIPVAGIAGDQQAALFGQLCLRESAVKATYGTGCFVMMNTGERPRRSDNNMLSTIAWQIDGKATYALEGSVFVGGAVIQWLRDGLGIIRSAEETEKLAFSVEDNGGVYFVPALTGLGAPYWDQYARGTIMGITRDTTSANIVRAALESIAFQVSDVVKAMEADLGVKITEMKVDGGAVANNYLMQFQADLNRSLLVRPSILESTAMGAAYMAGLAVGFWKSTDEIEKLYKIESKFAPRDNAHIIDEMNKRWNEAVKRSLGWAKE